MAMKRNKILLVSLLSVLGLTACSNDVASYPEGGAILPQAEGTETIYNNELESIYEDLRDGALASDVLNKLLYSYANTIFGRFSASAPVYGTLPENEITLEVANKDASKMDTFVKSHKAYWPGESEPTGDELNVAKAKVAATYQSVKDRIAEALYNKISSGTYSKNNIFDEAKFLAALKFDGKKVKDYKTTGLVTYKGLLDPEVEAKDVFGNFLTEAYYWDEANGITYAIDENIETIYNDLLVEQYIVDESKATIGRSAARKVNVLAIKASDEYVNEVPALIDYVINNKIAKAGGLTVAANDRHGEDAVKSLFDSVGKIMKGLPAYFDGTDDDDDTNDGEDYDVVAAQIIEAINDNGLYGNIPLAGNNYLKSTEYGTMMQKYLKIDNDLIKTNTEYESDFTGNGKYTIQQGKKYEEDKISLKKYVTTGWYINSGLADLPESIKTRLFNISVANALDQKDADRQLPDRTVAGWTRDAENKINKYVAKANGAYFLKRESVEDVDSNDDLYFFDSSSNTYYIVQVVEAISPAKLGDGDASYAKVYSDNLLQETIQRDVNEIVAQKTSYSGLAKEHWLKEMSLVYHDTVIYDYFKENYPDLFE